MYAKPRTLPIAALTIAAYVLWANPFTWPAWISGAWVLPAVGAFTLAGMSWGDWCVNVYHRIRLSSSVSTEATLERDRARVAEALAGCSRQALALLTYLWLGDASGETEGTTMCDGVEVPNKWIMRFVTDSPLPELAPVRKYAEGKSRRYHAAVVSELGVLGVLVRPSTANAPPLVNIHRAGEIYEALRMEGWAGVG